MIFGYARISTTKDTQTTQRQLLTLKQYAKANSFTFDEINKEYKIRSHSGVMVHYLEQINMDLKKRQDI